MWACHAIRRWVKSQSRAKRERELRESKIGAEEWRMNAGFRSEVDAAAGSANIRFWMQTFQLRFQRTGGRIERGRTRLASALHSEGCFLFFLFFLPLSLFHPPSLSLTCLKVSFSRPQSTPGALLVLQHSQGSCATGRADVTLIIAAITLLISCRQQRCCRRDC